MTESIGEAKRALRARIRSSRDVRPAAKRIEAEDGIRTQGSALVARTRARTVACFLSAPAEPPTRALLADMADQGIRVLLPISGANGRLDWALDTGEERASHLGVPEPAGEPLGAPALEEADLILAPAAAVDTSGQRLGWGRGYYDRALSALRTRPPVYAVIYDLEVVDRVPHEAHDVPMTGAVTPTRTLSFDR
ncbi:5-formyltetrahydrofolate cyclo-ligase [Microbacterium sp. G2-8]|uniref:5-formyltetrahydrofolate cyclo-ligase n=1 Tax=Microbacterium sp. G2-8 TaxID=2842454 RepID=UPI001C89559D|nr:5-formyltetrahydrofolate cyclo-ligase [Microbacterium sp. G2-8]